MPLVRYFTVVGSLLLALLFLADWYFPKLIAAPATAGVDKTIIRLHSAHKWPEATVFDTSLPTIVPPPAAAAADGIPPAANTGSPQQAFALALPEARPARVEIASSPRKHHQKRRIRTAVTHARRIASFETTPPAGW